MLSSNPNSVYYYPSYSGSITVESCQSACRGHGFRYAGLYDSASCFCGADLPNPGAQASTVDGVAAAQGSAPGTIASTSTCHVTGQMCAGNSTEFCGSSTATDIYEDTSFSNSSTVRAAENFYYIGCFSNVAPGPLYVTLETPATSDCASYCGELGYTYMGRSGFNSETATSTCGCGTEVQTGNQVDESLCNYSCEGDTDAA